MQQSLQVIYRKNKRRAMTNNTHVTHDTMPSMVIHNANFDLPCREFCYRAFNVFKLPEDTYAFRYRKVFFKTHLMCDTRSSDRSRANMDLNFLEPMKRAYAVAAE